MRLIRNYISKEFIGFFLACLLSLVFISIIFSVLAELETLDNENGLTLFIQSVLSGLPLLIELVTPISVLLATVLTFISLSKSSEIIAMMAAGVSLFHLVFPVLLIGSLIAGFTYCNQSYLAPMLGSDKRTGFVHSRSDHSTWKFANGKLYHFSEPSIRTKEVKKGLIFHFNSDHRIKQVKSLNRLKLKDKYWKIDNASEIVLSSDEVITKELSLNSIPEKKLPIVFKKELSHPKYSPFNEIISEIRIKQQGAVSYDSDIFALYQKIAGILSIFTMILLALPFSLYSSRSVNVRTGIVVSIVMGLVFWLADQILISLNGTGTLLPEISAFGANILFIVLALTLIRLKRT